ncbi:transposase, IS605 OrfB family [Clostridium argentinense CDC 2741]|uniref:Transposase, IS605 OrfB family n=1 Tax=Clostridium argentinense CDC 2741 TaxID=1418104 RepID=A0A0C1TVH4_9CLOT|nr:RNA-guided endonuclease TnpB family protein [Clostridium argentinense]ARC83780.1 transposase [Clostridium argentinense]KIE44734.1 transposase, IS605 OrfB family [Clostridium argentinense CDC 2741]NFF39686.1 IS200/IS605 family element transposase accessory protein TnpB [Clostridium argentinense]NFP49686.1 IS200/IS605 family element transposase accessory protein TnpB [Clostridium argentinense]NFP72087.1 IS200/IS605 family element transposase accessory protein TnpB [Clostridium argentinense]
MIKALNIRLYPTKEQIILMYKHIGCMRFVYNWALSKQIENYKINNKKLSVSELAKELTILKNTKGYEWMYEISNATLKESIRDLDKAYKNFFNGSSFPKFKSKKKSNHVFYTRYDRIYFKEDFVNLEKIGKVKCRVDYDIDLATITKFQNPRIHFNGRVWVLSVGIETSVEKAKLNDFSLGIDLGITQLAITNIDNLDTKNINKTNSVKKLNKRLKRLQRQCSRKYEKNKEGGSYQKTKNIVRLEKKIKKLHSKLKNIRLNHIHQSTSKMVKAKPFRVVMEDLKVSNMMKNKHLSKAIAEQGFNKFINQMKYKCEKYGIEFIQVPILYPSSKTCSHCGYIKKDLKLSDRIYKCSCGFSCDRDKNASYNLANYGLV